MYYAKCFIKYFKNEYVVFELNDIGHRAISTFTYKPILKNKLVKLFFKNIIVNEKEIVEFAFLSEVELYFFETVTQISGIGPKTAIAILEQIIFSSIAAIGDERLILQIESLKKINNKTKTLILEKLEKQESPNRIKRQFLSEALLKMGHSEEKKKQILEKADYSLSLKEIIQNIIRNESR